MIKHRVVITGLGVVAPNGVGIPAFLEALQKGKSGLSHQAEMQELNFACQIAGIPPLEKEDLEGYISPIALRNLHSTGIQYAIKAGVDAWKDAGLNIIPKDGKTPDWDSGCIFGASLTGVEATRYGYEMVDEGRVKRLGGRLVEQGMASGPSAYLGGILGLGNQVSSNSSACATGTEAIIQAYQRIQAGLARRILTGSCDSKGRYVWGPFDSLRVLSRKFNDAPTKASRPMSATAAGFVPGAGAGALVLESLGSARKRGATIYAEVLGGAVCAGGQRGGGSMTAPNPMGVQHCIKLAIQDAGIEAGEIDAINGHLTATMGDPMEVDNWVKSLNRSGGDFPFIQSLKSLIGHCLSAAGSIESVACILQLKHNFFHLSANSEDLHPKIAELIDPVKVPQQTLFETGFKTIAKANFGFGDVNAAVLFRAWMD